MRHSPLRLLSLVGSTLLVLNCSSGNSGTPSGAGGTSATGAAGAGSAGTTGGRAGTTAPTGTAGTAATGTAGTTAAGTAGTAATGTAGTAATGTAGTAATGTAGTTAAGTGGTAADTGQSVLTRNKHETRDGFFTQPTLTKVMAAKMAPDTAFNTGAKFAGQMWASPLYMEQGPAQKGTFFVVTLSDMVYAIDETTGTTVWMHSIGTAPAQGFSGCGNTSGITSTPVIDAASRTLYLAGVTTGGGGVAHEIHALSVDTGMEKAGWPVDVSTLSSNNPGFTGAFAPKPHNQRSALSLVNGILYVAYGGHIGDCSDYHGWVVAINAANPTMKAAWGTGGVGEAIWAAGGMASNGDGVFAITGNSTRGVANHLDSEEVVHVTGMAQVNRTTGLFFPGSWKTMDQQDADFGSTSPVIINVGGTSYVAAAAKDGHFYLLNPASLGGSTPLADFMIANGGAMAVKTTPAAYVSGMGVHVVMNAGGAVCGNGTTGNIVSVTVAAGPTVKPAWCAQGGEASPIATSTNGKDETVVWFMNGGALKGVDGDTGAMIYSGGNCNGVRKWTSPIAVKGRIIAGGDGGLCSWSPH